MNKTFIRAMAIILAVLTVFGTVAMVIGSVWTASALEEYPAIEITDTVISEAEDDISSASSLSDRIIRVGLFFRNSSYDELRMNHSISSVTGFRFFMADESGLETASFSTSAKSISIVREDNVFKNDDGVYEATDEDFGAQIHTVALKMKDSFPDEHSLKQELAFATSKNGYDPMYPLFDGGRMYLGMGDYETAEYALDRFVKLQNVYKRNFALKDTNTNYVTVIDNETGDILLRANTEEYGLRIEPNYKKELSEEDDDAVDSINTAVLALSPGAEDFVIEEPVIEYDTLPYIVTAVGNVYAGTFEYKATDDGISLTNILTLDDYVKSVIPFEIYNDWPEEAIKAFAIVSRTYALSSFHSGEDFDMCSETHCQAYLGRGRSTEYSDSCVDAVKGMILTYDGEPAKTFYHAISGGATESAANVWGGASSKYPYLVSVMTPEEKYASHPNGFWSTSVTMKQVSDYILSKASYAEEFTGSITDLTVLETTPAGYIYKVRLTDSDGNELIVKTSDKIRIMLSKFVKSANFIISRGTPVVKAGSMLDTFAPGTSYPVLTAEGEGTVNYSDGLFAISSSGTSALRSDGSMQFVGKGYGHGVGLSQFGAHDMAVMGYSYDKILSIYYPGTEITTI